MPLSAPNYYIDSGGSCGTGLRSGKALVLNFTVPCPPVQPTDCHAIWVAIGECETDGSGIMMRFTIEVDAMAGGVGCLHEDGYVEKRPCIA